MGFAVAWSAHMRAPFGQPVRFGLGGFYDRKRDIGERYYVGVVLLPAMAGDDPQIALDFVVTHGGDLPRPLSCYEDQLQGERR